MQLDDNLSVDAHIRIYPDNNVYRAELRVSGVKTQRFRIGLTPHDVEELNEELQQSIENISRVFYEEDSECNEGLAALVNAGKSAFNRIFTEGVPRETIQKALGMIDNGGTIEVSSENFFIPWELLYHASLNDPYDASNFWGMRYIIARTLIQDDRPGDMVSPIIWASRPKVGLIAYKELEYIAYKEIPALQKLHQENQISLSCLRSLDFNQRSRELRNFSQFLCQQLHIVHFACHAYVESPLNHSYLHISDQFYIKMQDFHAYDFKIPYNPLVILNACRTGTINPLQTSNWAALFWGCGARGVLATEFRVPDWFAAVFVEQLYKYLLAGMPIGKSLRLARLYFLMGKHDLVRKTKSDLPKKEASNPLGLAYALYSPPSVRIVNPNTWREKHGQR